MVHDTVSSVAATSRRMALRCFVPGVAAPIMPIPWNVPAPSSVLNAHPMECSSTIQCFECPSHGMFQHHLVFWPGDPCCCRWTESSCLDGCRPALFLDRVQQIVKVWPHCKMKKTPVYASVQRGTWNQSDGAVQHQVLSEGVRWGHSALLLATEP